MHAKQDSLCSQPWMLTDLAVFSFNTKAFSRQIDVVSSSGLLFFHYFDISVTAVPLFSPIPPFPSVFYCFALLTGVLTS